MIVVTGNAVQGASIPIRGVYLHGVGRSAIAAPCFDRQREDEAAAVSGLAFDPDPPAVELDETFRERKP
jgi:hypothetical protein